MAWVGSRRSYSAELALAERDLYSAELALAERDLELEQEKEEEEKQEEEQEKPSHSAVFIRAVNPSTHHSSWYKINPFTSTIRGKDKKLTPITAEIKRVPLLPYVTLLRDVSDAACVVKSRLMLYMFGTCSPGSYYIYFCDATDTLLPNSNNKLIWKVHRQKTCAKRIKPLTVSINQKIYLFGSKESVGGNYNLNPYPWGEVFDTADPNTPVKPLAPPPKDLARLKQDRLRTAAVGYESSCIVLGTFHHRYYVYYVMHDCWLSLPMHHPLIRPSAVGLSRDHPYPPIPTSEKDDVIRVPPNAPYLSSSINVRHAMVDNMLYVYFRGHVYVFDLTKEEWFHGPIQGLPYHQYISPRERLYRGGVHHLGNGKLCVVLPSCVKGGYIYRLHCVLFTPVLCNDSLTGKRCAKAQVESYGSYLIHGDHFDDAMALELPEEVFQGGTSALTKVVCLNNVLTPNDVSGDEYEDMLDGMRKFGELYGKLVNVVIPRPNADGELSPGLGKIFLEYADIDGAFKAVTQVYGKQHGGNRIVAFFYPENKFAEGDYSGSPNFC